MAYDAKARLRTRALIALLTNTGRIYFDVAGLECITIAKDEDETLDMGGQE